MNNFLFLFLFLITISVNLILAQNLKHLSKKEMTKDFEAFIKFQKEVNPQLEIQKNVTGVDIIFELEKFKNNIDTITLSNSYYALLYIATGLCRDLHNRPYDGFSLNFNFFLHFFSFNRQLNFLQFIRKSFLSFNSLIYLNGKFYNRFPFYLDDINLYMKYGKFSGNAKFVPIGIPLKTLYNFEPDSFILKYAIKSNIRWDFINKKFYSDEISFFKTSIINNSVTCFINQNSNEIFWKSSDSTIVIIDRNTYNFNDSAFVKFIEKDKILFIRMPFMSNGEFYQKEIVKFKNQKINKVIIDIRGNPGGDDNTWYQTLITLISEPIEINFKTIARNTKLARKLINKKNPKILEGIPYLTNNNYIVLSDQKKMINPDINSIKYNGKIYILKDENSYSSSLAFSSIAEHTKNIILVGRYSGRIGGFGITPVKFTLPYSKIILQLEPVLDLTGCKTQEDVYHDNIKILVDPDLKFYDDLFNTLNPYSEDFLYKKDPYFIKVLND